MKVVVILTEDWANKKKGDEVLIDAQMSNILINQLKVGKPKKIKSKTKE
jgi:hypothetical protein